MSSYPYIVAEMSANHEGNLDRALRIIEKAKLAGANAVKLQTYTPDTMVADRDYKLFAGPWAGRTLHDLYAQAQTPWHWHATLFMHCEQLGLHCFSTPFCERSVKFLEMLRCPMYKIASFEITDIPLIQCVARTGKPIVISTGMATYQEIEEAVRAARNAGASEITLLKCTSSYPASPKDSNIETMEALAVQLNCSVGISDHTKGIGAAVAAAVLGADMIEKHLKLDDSSGLDAEFSLTPQEFKTMVDEIRNAVDSLGQIEYGPRASELHSLQLRRSLYIVKDINAGEILTKENVRPMRPALGIEPKHYDIVLGHQAKTDIKAGTPLSWDMIG